MKTIPDLMKEFTKAAGRLMKGLDQMPNDDVRYQDIWKYKGKGPKSAGRMGRTLEEMGRK